MKNYLFISYGYEAPTPEIMEAWGNWFASIADRIVEKGSPLGQGREITASGTKPISHEDGGASGFMIFKAENIEEAEKIAARCPVIVRNVVQELMPMGEC